MVLKFYHAPYTELPDTSGLTMRLREVADWVVFQHESWPRRKIFGDGFAARNIDEAVQEHFFHWAKDHLSPFSVVVTHTPIYRRHAETFRPVPIAAMTYQDFPLIVLATRFSAGPEISSDIQALSLAHEFLHLARNVTGSLSNQEIDETRHCRNDLCILRKGRGETPEEFVGDVQQRSTMPCSLCQSALELLRLGKIVGSSPTPTSAASIDA